MADRLKRIKTLRQAADDARQRRESRRLAEAMQIRVSVDGRGDEMLVLASEPGVGSNRVVMMAWERPYMEALADTLDVTPSDDVLEVGFGLGFSARAIAARRPRSHVILEPAPHVLQRARGCFDVRPFTWQTFCSEADIQVDAAFFDDFPLDDGETIASSNSRWPAFLRAVSRLLKPGARVTGYLADKQALHLLPAPFVLEKLDVYCGSPPPECPYLTAHRDACLLPLIRFAANATTSKRKSATPPS